MPMGNGYNKRTYLHNNVTPSLFHYQHIRTAQVTRASLQENHNGWLKGLQSKSIFDVDDKKKKTTTFKEVWARVAGAFPSIGEIIIFAIILILFTYGFTLFLRTKFSSKVKHSEL